MSSAPVFTVTRTATPATAEGRAAAASAPFGTAFTDHWARATWNAAEGWHDHRIEPLAPMSLHPAATVLHYGQQVFEGLKAYRWTDGSIHLFRPERNAARLAQSAERMALPPVPDETFLAACEQLLAVEQDWVPDAPETSLYLRPTLMGTAADLGVHPSPEVEFFVLAAPVGAYFAGGVKPVSIWVAQDFHRAGPGGTGQAKTAGNYAASLLPQQQAVENGCDQVLFLDGKQNRYVEELGGMNVMAVYGDGAVVTPRLTGTILPGVTRSSVLDLLRAQGRDVVETDLALDDLRHDIASGDIVELFACGTAAVITPIGRLKAPEFEVTVGDGEAGALTMGLRSQLTDIQYGRAEDPFGWVATVS